MIRRRHLVRKLVERIDLLEIDIEYFRRLRPPEGRQDRHSDRGHDQQEVRRQCGDKGLSILRSHTKWRTRGRIISRILFRRTRRRPGHSSMRSTRDLSGRSRSARAAPSAPYSILLRTGFALRRRLRGSPVVSYTTFSPLPCALRHPAVCFLWHFPSTPIWQRLSRVNHGTSRPAESGLSSPRRSRGMQRPVPSPRVRQKECRPSGAGRQAWGTEGCQAEGCSGEHIKIGILSG